MVLQLPLYHCELNPTELVRAEAKQHESTNNKELKTSEMERLLKEGFANATMDNQNGYVQHVIKIKEQMWKTDESQDTEPTII